MEEGLSCPITFEPFAETGDRKPVVLPLCGHSISLQALRNLVAHNQAAGNRPIRCPKCNREQSKTGAIERISLVTAVHDCPTNWGLVEGIQELKRKQNILCHLEAQARHDIEAARVNAEELVHSVVEQAARDGGASSPAPREPVRAFHSFSAADILVVALMTVAVAVRSVLSRLRALGPCLWKLLNTEISDEWLVIGAQVVLGVMLAIVVADKLHFTAAVQLVRDTMLPLLLLGLFSASLLSLAKSRSVGKR